MASSGYMSTSNQYVKFWMEVITNSQNISNNTSNITVKVWAKRTNSGYTTSGSGSIYLKVENGGANVYEHTKSAQISITSSSSVYHEWTGNVTHASDGSRWIQITSNIQIPGILSSSSCGYGEWLTTIPRTSSFTINKTSCVLGEAYAVSISRASTSFTHSVSYSIGGERRYQQNWNGTATSISYTPPVSDSSYFKTSTSGSVTIIVDTYSGSTLIGTASKSLKVVVPNNVIPSFTSLTATRVDNGVPPSWNKYVQNKSKCTLNINGASGSYGSTITKYSITGGGFSGTTPSYTTGVLASSGSITFTATITDSRGRSVSKTTSINVEPYANPVITSFTTNRCNSDGTLNNDGIYAKCVATYSVSAVTSSNKNSYFRYRKLGDTTWSSNISGVTTILSNIDNNFSYEVQFVANDYFTSSSRIDIIQTAFVTMDFKAGGKGIAIGKVAQTDNLFDVAMPTNFSKDICLGETTYINGVGNDAMKRTLIGNTGTRLIIGDKNNQHTSVDVYGGETIFYSTIKDTSGHKLINEGRLPMSSSRDNPNGFLVRTHLLAQNGLAWYLKIQGNSYGGSSVPTYLIAQGYLYSGGIINACGVNMSGGANIPNIDIFGYNGYLHFWFPQSTYWEGYMFEVYQVNVSTGARTDNKVAEISNSSRPSSANTTFAKSIAIKRSALV